MDLFGCCKQVQSSTGYQVTSRKGNKTPETKFFNKSSDISKDLLASPNASIIKINKSAYDTIAKQYRKKDKKWTDFQFPPNDQSLGLLKHVTSSKWKRISDIVTNPVIFKSPLTPSEVVHSENGDKAFLATIASLTERPQRIHNLFDNQVYNPNGIYKVLLRVKSQIEQVLIDDYVPVNQDEFPLFSKPHQNQIWVLLLEKARAKIHGSYSNMIQINDSPKQIFQQIDFAPTQTIKVPPISNQAQSTKVWRIIYDNLKKNRPIVVKADKRAQINWNILNLVSNGYYSLIDSISLKNSLGKQEKVLKLRNPYGQTQWKGTAHENDKVFWDQIEENQSKIDFFAVTEQGKDGVFFILYSDFLKYFTDIYLNFYEHNGSYLAEDLFYNLKNGLLHEMEVYNEGFYTISLDQQLQAYDDGWTETSLLIIKKYTQNFKFEYEFIDGALNLQKSSALLKSHLTPGNYLIYSKIRPTAEKGYFPKNPHLVIYSQNNVKLVPSSQYNHHQLLKKTFLNFGRTHKRQLYNDDLMWMSWKYFNQGGYAYIAFGNDRDSHQKFIVNFNQADFNEKGFILKKPLKGKGSNQTIEVLPGQEGIILVSLSNKRLKSVKFPPKINVKIQPYIRVNEDGSLPSLPSPGQRNSNQNIMVQK